MPPDPTPNAPSDAPKIKPFNEIAKDFDPMMPKVQYDALRTKYFDDHVAPKVPQGFSTMATHEEFMKQTERAPLISHPLSAKAQLGAVSAGAELLQPLQALDPAVKSAYKASRQKQQQLTKVMQREGISTGAGTAGTFIGGGLAIAGLSAATDGLGAWTGVSEILGEAVTAAKLSELAARTSKGALTFGTFEALSAERGHRGYAFARGAAWGAAGDGSLSLIGKLARRVPKSTPEQIEKEVQSAFTPQPAEKITPIVDQTTAEHFVSSQKQAKAEGKPFSVEEDKGFRGTVVMGTGPNGRPFTVKIQPGMEDNGFADVKASMGNTGGVDTVTYHPDEIKSYNTFAGRMKALVPQMDTMEVKVPPGEEAKVAASMNLEGIGAEPHPRKAKVTVQAPAERAPSEMGIRQQLMTHELPDGTRLTKGEQWDYAKRIALMWRKDLPYHAKEATARQLMGKDLERFMPAEWRDWATKIKEEPAAAAEDTAKAAKGDETFEQLPEVPESDFEKLMREARADVASQEALEKENDELERAYQEEIAAKSKGVHPMAPLGQEFPEEGGHAKGFQIERGTKGPTRRMSPKERLAAAVPASERRIFKINEKGGPVEVRFRRDRVTVRLSEEQMERLSPGAGALVMRGGSWADILRSLGMRGLGDVRPIPGKPVEAWTPGMGRRITYHEGLHVQLGVFNEGLITQMMKHPVADDIGIGLKKLFPDSYGDLGRDEMWEEGFVHAAQAVREGDTGSLRAMAMMDTSIPHVVDMVDNISNTVLDRLPNYVDTMENRAFQTRLEDLLRRTGRMRLERWEDGAKLGGEELHYDPETDEFVSKHPGGSTRIGPKGSVADHLESIQAGAEYAPSHTQIWEETGLMRRFAAKGGVPRSQKDLPMPELAPDKDRFRGIMAATALLRPTQDWFADLDQQFEKIGRKTGVFNAFKEVDDAVRKGSDWLTDHMTSAAQFLKGDANNLKTMFEFVAADPKHWDRMLPRFGKTPEFLADVRAADKWLTDFRNETNIQVFNYLRNDLQLLRNFNFENRFAFGGRAKDLSEMSFFHRAIESGELDPRDNHLGRFINYIIKQGYEKKFTAEPLAKLAKIARMEDAGGNSVFGPTRYAINQYINYVKGIPDASQQIITKAFSDAGKVMTQGFKELNKLLPKGVPKLPEEFNYPGSTLNKFMSLSYAAGIGARPAIPVRDALQVVTNTMPILGPQKFFKGLQLAMTSDGWKLARQHGALLGRHNVEELFGDIFQEIGPHSGSAMDKALQISQMLLAPSRWGHNFGRAVTYLGEYGSAIDAISAYRKGAINVRQLFEDTSMWFMPKPLQTRLLADVMDKGAAVGEVARKIALETVDSTLWAYRRGTQPLALRTGLGRIFGQYGMWPLNYMEFLRKLVIKRSEYKSKAYGAMALWMASNYAGSSALSAMGGDVSKWFFLSPAGYGGSPHLQMIQNILKLPEESEEGRAARKEVLKYPLNFIPGQVEMGAIIKAMEDGGPAFEGGQLTPNAIRVLGMRPKKDMPDMSLEDKIEYEAGFKQRHTNF